MEGLEVRGGEIMRYYTCTEFAERYNVTRQTVIHHIKRGNIEAELSETGIYMIPETADVPPAWKHGEKGRVANARYGVTDES